MQNENAAFDASFKGKLKAARNNYTIDTLQEEDAGFGYKLSAVNMKRSRLKKLSLIDSEQEVITKINELISQQKQKEEIIKQLEEENIPQQLGDRWKHVLDWCECNAA